MQNKLINRCLIGIGMAVLLLVVVLVIRTLSFTAPPLANITPEPLDLDGRAIAGRLSQAIQFRTVSVQLNQRETQQQYRDFIDWLAATYPEVHTAMPPKKLGKKEGQEFSLLYTWPGKNSELPPILMSAHYDVVPVIPGTEDDWQHPPYAGVVDDTHIWGRGTLDDKGAAIALMEAATSLLKQGYQPERTVYISLTSDEETGGNGGTAAIVETLKNNGTQLDWSLDEGSFLLHGFIPGVEPPIASINVAEKGYLTVKLVAPGKGGHSSMPPAETAVDILAGALVRLNQNPLPGGLEGLSKKLFEAAARHMSFEKRLMFANQWLFAPVIESALEQQASTAAMLRTTTAATMLSASVKENVLPIEATATVNFRLHPRDSVDDVLAHIESVIDDERIKVVVRRGDSASKVSNDEAQGFRLVADTTQEVFGSVITAPGLTIAGTDSHRYQEIADNNYRFNPMLVSREDVHGFHGTNERISIDNMVKATGFYQALIRNANLHPQ
ncbi:M20 family peptidase [Microbulbifer sp. CAU 1566]|uniref:M20 family peptidase n=1 Tax=Microbulbifer sp. CAU 1566 TaxID=2933269 RepID=UPI002003D602|nr:M20 family peptidase [Microbulbifer sp. CAU 1566]MCK7595964.1 M20 family peptidase [Microbulbifer sp. CAU 1566]